MVARTPRLSTFVRRLRPATAALLLAVGVLMPADAHADESGASGRVVRLSINSTGSDEYASVHGRISIRSKGTAIEVYSWGGTMCPASKLSEAEIRALQHAFHNRNSTTIAPRYKSGEVKGTRCLVAFELSGG